VTENHSFAQLYKYSSGLSFAALEDEEINGNRVLICIISFLPSQKKIMLYKVYNL